MNPTALHDNNGLMTKDWKCLSVIVAMLGLLPFAGCSVLVADPYSSPALPHAGLYHLAIQRTLSGEGDHPGCPLSKLDLCN